MITAHSQLNTHLGSLHNARKTLMRANGAFLALVGGTQVIFELLSHFFGVGPWGRIFAGSHYTIGFLEAHGLAFLIGLLLIGVAAANPKRFWHGFAASVHALVGGANLLFWSSFVYWGLVPMGAIATLFHGLFLVAQLFLLLRAPTHYRGDITIKQNSNQEGQTNASTR
jgi:hypothetical protein